MLNNLHAGDSISTVPELDLDQITAVGALGRGAKGVVFLARHGPSGELLALKVVLKELLRNKNKKSKNRDLDLNLNLAGAISPEGAEYRRICFEQEVLARFRHPLLPRLRGVLRTERVIGYAIDYCSGGDLVSLRRRQTEKMFSDEVIRFYAAELVLALEYVHSLGIVYRDLKPENIMIQENGHIMLVDFDLSTYLPPPNQNQNQNQNQNPNPLTKSPPKHKHRSSRKKRLSSFKSLFNNSGISPLPPPPPQQQQQQQQQDPKPKRIDQSRDFGKSNSFVGTEEYVAPEIILGNGHDFSVDYWSLGIVLYEMLYGHTPFRGTNRKDTFSRILSRPPDLVGETTSLRSLIGGLLVKDPTARIGAAEIKGHDFFKMLDWDRLTEMDRPPYIPDGTVTVTTEGGDDVDVELFVEKIFGSGGDGAAVEPQVPNPEHHSSKDYLVF